jgi:hypothetical protein
VDRIKLFDSKIIESSMANIQTYELFVGSIQKEEKMILVDKY